MTKPGSSGERKDFKSSSGFDFKAVYSASDLSTGPSEKNSPENELPDQYPYTRGIHKSMYRSRLWTMRQYAGFGSAKESNARYKMLLEKGQTGLSVAFDLPTQMGYDSDHVMSIGEVGKVGVAISSLEDMQTLLKDLPLDKISTSMTINSTAGILLAFYIAVAKSKGVDPKKISGTIQNDLLKEYIARGTYIFPPRPSMRIITDIFDYCRTEVPQWNTISISGYHIREAGSTAAQEVAFTLANAITYVDAALARGLAVDSFAPRLSFFFNVHNNFLEEIAKFRAARRMWAKIMKERFHAKEPNSLKLRFHSQTAGSTLTAQQPENNIVRVALQAMAAVLGGTQSLHTNSMDEALGLPTEKSATIALRTQQVIGYESGAADIVDPLGGSYLIESMTDEIERRANDIIARIEDLGGVIKCIESGWIQQEIQTAAYIAQKNIDAKTDVVVGMNDFVSPDKAEPEVLRIKPQVEKDQIKRLKAFKKQRNAKSVGEALSRIGDAAKGNENLMPLFVHAVENHVTLGEIADCLRQVFGQYREKITL